MGGEAECEAEHGVEAVLGVGVLWWDTCPYPCPCPLTSRLGPTSARSTDAVGDN